MNGHEGIHKTSLKDSASEGISIAMHSAWGIQQKEPRSLVPDENWKIFCEAASFGILVLN